MPYIGRKLFKSQDNKATDNLKPSPSKETTLVDLMSSWDSSAQTAPGIQSFIKDESQILKPVKPGEEAEEEEKGEEGSGESIPEDLYAVPVRRSERRKPESAGVSQFSVERLSQIFEEKASGLQESSPVHAASGDKTAPAKTWGSKSPPKSPTKALSKSPEPKPLPPLPTAEMPATAPIASAPSGDYDYPPDADYDYPPEEEFIYKVLYDYAATDTTELTIREGDMVVSVPGFTADMSPGWLMVRQEGELDEGWVPESYVTKLGPVYEPEPVSTKTGQIPSPQNPTCKFKPNNKLYILTRVYAN